MLSFEEILKKEIVYKIDDIENVISDIGTLINYLIENADKLNYVA